MCQKFVMSSRALSLFCSFSLSLSALSFSLPPRRKEINFDIFSLLFCCTLSLSQTFNFNLLCAANSRAKATKKEAMQRQQQQQYRQSNKRQNARRTIPLSCALSVAVCVRVCVCVWVFFASFLFLSII